jgi:hypothetical protein
MFVPFSWCGSIPLGDLGTEYVYQMPATTSLFARQQFPRCIAAKLTKVAFRTEHPRSKRPPETGGLCIPEDKSFGSD